MEVGDDERVLLHIHLQETYHTRLLAEAVSIFALPVRARPPALLPRRNGPSLGKMSSAPDGPVLDRDVVHGEIGRVTRWQPSVDAGGRGGDQAVGW